MREQFKQDGALEENRVFPQLLVHHIEQGCCLPA